MKTQIILIDIKKLKPHEMINEDHLVEIIKEIKADGVVKDPIIVDHETLIILDGHHRYNASLRLGLVRIPACMVDYNSEEITVAPFRDGEQITKDVVKLAGLSGKLLRPKTSKHFIPERPINVNIPLGMLR